ncbi:hypothetical protein [Roseivirga misakiensis]|uniref:DUF4421 domain-containing protein n=1 Tax=Roseivirga misakiensis TaxID=1563681 RepID=A0A1E5SZT4_9BACT|nr:hypothetical protein [Roseivirga misakiensis]OEK04631.1 hypothetical protein BFP71_14340 [Roseivirga misakiensis]
MLKQRALFLIIPLLLCSAFQTEAQLFKRKNKKANVDGFVLEVAPDPEKEKRKAERKLVNPIRKALNKFNFSIEKGFGYFTYRNPLTDVSVIRDPRGDQLYAVPLGEEEGNTSPLNAYDNWFNRISPIGIERIDDDSHIVRTDTVDLSYTNNGSINPLTFRLSFSIKKLDKKNSELTKDKVYTDEDLVRIGGGISFGAINFRNSVSTQEVSSELRSFTLPRTKLSTTKIFGSLTYNFYTLGDYSILADVMGGVWKIKSSHADNDLITYDPFFNVGIMFQQKFSKYFKGYIRPSVEFRSYTIANEFISAQHKYTVFSIDLGLLLKYPTYPRNKYKADQVQLEHVFEGKIYRGRPFYRKQNPRYGENRIRRKPRGYSFAKPKKKKTKKGN